MDIDKTPEKIQAMFDEISEYYDKMNNFISLGTHYIIKFLALKELAIQPRTMIIDLCCGTGDFTKIISNFYPRAKVIGLDFSNKMLKLAKSKNPNGVFIQSDCTNLPFAEGEFDYITNKPMYFIFTKLVPLYRKIIRNKSKKEIENEVKKNQ